MVANDIHYTDTEVKEAVPCSLSIFLSLLCRLFSVINCPHSLEMTTVTTQVKLLLRWRQRSLSSDLLP